ncbi:MULTISPECIES: WXG100 family type VII secretion target [Streptomyces]|uniref:WXG100 family type VII secretion target n=1 Tax=Streptomyces TaxID=1883 RepID=UPI00196248EE|nr:MULTISPECIES: WXG100 family type VII secretion target [Streptomyces]QRX90596.1 WXG100 family type VII secretion target [Streptomyces noursei]UJB40527.1 WXG100 family type VII secretion target [Streptomyces sp. A1-5]
MALELPDAVVSFLDFIGVHWPNVDEDKVRDFGSHVRDFANNIQQSHQDATSSVEQLSEVYQGASYDALMAKWGQMSSSHMNELVTACHTVATALDAAAGVIVGMKAAAIAELVVLAVTFVADQAAAAVTFGLAEAAEAGIIAAARKATSYLEQQLEQYVIGQVIEAAITPLVDVVGNAVSGLVYEGTAKALGVSGGGGAGQSFSVHPEELHARSQALSKHAETVAAHAEDFKSKLSGVSFA